MDGFVQHFYPKFRRGILDFAASIRGYQNGRYGSILEGAQHLNGVESSAGVQVIVRNDNIGHRKVALHQIKRLVDRGSRYGIHLPLTELEHHCIEDAQVIFEQQHVFAS